MMDRFESTARYYSRFRKPYPPEMFSLTRERFSLDGRGVLLDVGCGTGQLALPLAGDFRQVLGIDISTEMVSEARRAAATAGVHNADFEVSGADHFTPRREQRFRLIAFGSSLHWTDPGSMLRRCRDWLDDQEPDSGVAIAGMRSIWGGESEWERVTVSTVMEWLGEERRAGHGLFDPPLRPYADLLADAGFTRVTERSIAAGFELDVPYIIGHLYSTSYCNRALLGQESDRFEADLSNRLLALCPSGRFRWDPGVSCVFGHLE